MSRFKVGDKVRYKDDVGPVVDFQVEGDDIGTVVSCFNDGILVSFGSAIFLREDEIELVTPTDPKRKFLERLQSLLREFGATINISWNEYFDSDNAPCIDMDICFGDGTGVALENVLGKFITADNIMDFDKE